MNYLSLLSLINYAHNITLFKIQHTIKFVNLDTKMDILQTRSKE